MTSVTSCIFGLRQQIQESLISMASSEVNTYSVPTHGGDDDTFSKEGSSHAPADDANSALFQSTPPAMSSTKNVPQPPPLPCVTYHRLRAHGSRPSSCSSSSSRLVPKETVETWDKLFKQGTGADTYVEVDNTSHFLAHSCILVSFLFIHFNSCKRSNKLEGCIFSAGCSVTCHATASIWIKG